jgi:proton-translocating NADH-quinone oxidoreductase chain L
MTSLLIFIPLFSTILTAFSGYYLSREDRVFFSCFRGGLTLLFSFVLLYEVIFCDCPIYLSFGFWFDLVGLEIKWSLVFDSLTVSMLLIISLVAFLVLIYSTEYMSEDPKLPLFMSYLTLFLTSMLILVTSGTYLQLFIGWEGVGLCSYLLICFWYTRAAANSAALKAMLVNRIGDVAYLFAVGLVFFLFQTSDILLIQHLSLFFMNTETSLFVLECIAILFLIGAVGKSAQLFLHVWLPDAMEGPTPVSALIHAATMVTAGIYLIIRSYLLYESVSSILWLLTLFGGRTAFFSALIGIFQNDMKRVIAYSTCSQLGYMLLCCGFSQYGRALFHLVNHAFFKALLFLSAGAVIHRLSGEQDMRRMGGLVRRLPISYLGILIGSLALVGFPGFSGIYSKDMLLMIGASSFVVEGYVFYTVQLLVAFCTRLYSAKLLRFVFFGTPNGFRIVYSGVTSHLHSYNMNFALLTLILFSTFFGFFFVEIFDYMGFTLSKTEVFWSNYVFLESRPLVIRLLPVIFTFAGLILGSISYYSIFNNTSVLLSWVEYTGIKKFYYDQLYHQYLFTPFFRFGYEFSYLVVDRGFLEFFGPNGIFRLFNSFSFFSKDGLFTQGSFGLFLNFLVLNFAFFYFLFF